MITKDKMKPKPSLWQGFCNDKHIENAHEIMVVAVTIVWIGLSCSGAGLFIENNALAVLGAVIFGVGTIAAIVDIPLLRKQKKTPFLYTSPWGRFFNLGMIIYYALCIATYIYIVPIDYAEMGPAAILLDIPMSIYFINAAFWFIEIIVPTLVMFVFCWTIDFGELPIWYQVACYAFLIVINPIIWPVFFYKDK